VYHWVRPCPREINKAFRRSLLLIIGIMMDSPSPEQLLRNIKSPQPAPVHLWDPPFCGDMDLRIARDGSWIHEGKPIRRLSMIQLFASVLKLEGGDYYLVTPAEKVRIQVEDCPFVVTEMDLGLSGGQQRLKFSTNTGEVVYAGEEHQLSMGENPDSGEPHPIVHIRSGLNALLNRAVFYRLVNHAEHRDVGREQVLGIESDGVFFQLGDQPESP